MSTCKRCPTCGHCMNCCPTVTPVPPAPPAPEEPIPGLQLVENPVEAPPAWTLPMSFRKHNPWGWKHGEINAKGQLHPGYDLNDGPTAVADNGQPIHAPRPGRVVLAKRTDGWGTLLAIVLDETVNGRVVAVRFGHPRDIFVQWGEHVQAGQLIATCGDGHLPSRYTPHLHYDIVDVRELWNVTKSRGLGKPDFVWYQQGRSKDLFEKIYLDPRRFHPEIDAALK